MASDLFYRHIKFPTYVRGAKLKYKVFVISNIILEIYNIILEINNVGE
jgi:hypothetical protein